MRLLLLTTPGGLFWLLMIVIVYFSILLFGEWQSSKFSLDMDHMKPLEEAIRERLSARYDKIALGWLIGALAILWRQLGKQLKKIDRLFS